MKKIGFIGLGIMGLPMACHLMDAGYEMHIYASRKSDIFSREGGYTSFYNS